MGDLKEMLESLNTAVVACDADFKVTYANEKCKQMFKASMGVEGFVGSHMRDCHKPETMKKLEKLFAEYIDPTRKDPLIESRESSSDLPSVKI